MGYTKGNSRSCGIFWLNYPQFNEIATLCMHSAFFHHMYSWFSRSCTLMKCDWAHTTTLSEPRTTCFLVSFDYNTGWGEYILYNIHDFLLPLNSNLQQCVFKSFLTCEQFLLASFCYHVGLSLLEPTNWGVLILLFPYMFHLKTFILQRSCLI